jgi:hypothetical protein
MGDFLVFCGALAMSVVCARELGGAARRRGRLSTWFAALPTLIVLLSAILGTFAISEAWYALSSLNNTPFLALVSIFLAVFAVSQILYMTGVIESNPPIPLLFVLLSTFAVAEIVYAFGIIDADPLVTLGMPLHRLQKLMP